MVSDAKKKKAANKKIKQVSKVTGKDIEQVQEEFQQLNTEDKTNGKVEEVSDMACTGILTSHPLSRDLQLQSFSLLFHGHELLQDTELELNFGRRYGLLGLNGCGKSCLLKAIANREVNVPEYMDLFFLDSEAPATDMLALQMVMEVDQQKKKLEAEAEILTDLEMTPEIELRLTDCYDRLDKLGSDQSEARAAMILHGLGFDSKMQKMKTKEFSGGWRMRIALARALFVNPTILLLDEPTNHLDLEACVWLEEYLKKFNRILLIISHSQDFLNGVCTNIIHMHQKKLKYYSGNYDQHIITRQELEESQMKRYRWEQDQIGHMKEYIARFGHGSAKLARQAQSKEKTLDKMVQSGLTEKVESDRTLKLKFENVGKLPPPVLQFIDVTFGYSPDKVLYRNVDLGFDLDSRIALVGPNGAGKSTLLKLMVGSLDCLDGMVKRHNHLRIGQYHQHLTDLLDPDLNALQYMMRQFPGIQEEKMRSIVGRFGVTGATQTLPIKYLSDGLKSRVVFAWLAQKQPHMLLLDEPTNHLDIESIDSLAAAINDWDGGLILVSHDFRLISQVCKEIYEVKGHVRQWKGSIQEYKDHLRKSLQNLDNNMIA